MGGIRQSQTAHKSPGAAAPRIPSRKEVFALGQLAHGEQVQAWGWICGQDSCAQEAWRLAGLGFCPRVTAAVSHRDRTGAEDSLTAIQSSQRSRVLKQAWLMLVSRDVGQIWPVRFSN